MDDISVSRFVSSIIDDYDRNRNGVIDLKNNDPDESFFDRREVRETPNETVITVTRYSFDELFLRADKNKDNKVTRDEINDVVNAYDKDKDGKLTFRNFWEWISGKPEGELDVFDREIPERSRVIYQQTIPHHGPASPLGDFSDNPYTRKTA